MALPEPVGEPWVPEDTFGSRLSLIRNRFGWNVKEAASICGISHQSWRNWEAGGVPRDLMTTVERIASITGCSPRWLLLGSAGQNWKDVNPVDLHVLPGGRVSENRTRPHQLTFRFGDRLRLVPT
jgi:transcriptional regulator with XRE-family HTH domain